MRRDAARRWRLALGSALLAAACQGGDAVAPRVRAPATPSIVAAATEDDPCTVGTSIAVNQTINGSLESTDCKLDDGSYADIYVLNVTTTATVRIDMTSGVFDTYLLLANSNGDDLGQDNDGGGSTNARMQLSLGPGQYYILANSYAPGAFGAYTISVTAVGGTSGSGNGGGPGGTTCSTTPISLNQQANGTLSTSSCRLTDGSLANAHTLSLTSSTTVQIEMRSSAFDAYLILTDGTGNLITQDDDGAGGTNARIVRTLAPGNYTIWANSASTGASGAYTLNVTGLTFNGGISCQSSPIGLGQTASGTLSQTDCKLDDGSYAHPHSLKVTSSATVQIDLRSSAFDAFVLLTDAGGAPIANDDNSGGGTNARLVRTLAAGDYVVWANSKQANATGEYTLVITATAGGGSSTGGGTCSSGSLALGQTVNGTLSPTGCRLNDGSYASPYSFSLSAATTVRLDLRSSAFDANLILADAAGNVLARDDDGAGGTDARIVRSLPAGQYVAWVTTYAAGASGAFQLTLATSNSTTTCSSAATITLGETANGTLATSDCQMSGGAYADAYSFTIPAGTSRNVQLDMSSTAFDSYVILTKADGSIVAEDDNDGGSGNARVRVALAPGQYVIYATSYSPQATGAYQLMLTASGSGATEPCTQSLPLALGQNVSGVLASTDCRMSDGSFADVYAVDIAQPVSVQIDLKSTAFDPFLILTDAGGRQLAMDDDGGSEGSNARIRTKLAAGRYYIYANSFGVTGRGSYTLSLVVR